MKINEHNMVSKMKNYRYIYDIQYQEKLFQKQAFIVKNSQLFINAFL